MRAQTACASLVGLVYGLGLTIIGFFLAGAGHGTYILLRIASAPISLLGIVPSLAGAPIFWTAIGTLLPNSHKRPDRQILVGAMLLHYLSVLLVLFLDSHAEWTYFERVSGVYPLMVFAGGSLYLIGQIAVWLFWSRAASKINPAKGE